MTDIKVKSKTTIKKLDKAIVKTQKEKNNIVKLKNKTNDIENKQEQSINEYTYNKLQNGSTFVKDKGRYSFNRVGKKSIEETKENIKNTKLKIENYKFKGKNVKTAKTVQKLNNLKAPKYRKERSIIYKGNIRNTANLNKGINKSKIIVRNKIKKGKRTLNKITRGIKTSITGTKATIYFITAGGFISVTAILLICFLGVMMSIYNIGGDEDTKSIWNSSLVTVAKSQIGVTGGEPYWSWYGFKERVEWCACFVSWCAEQVGYIQNGEIPKYSGCIYGIEGFKENGKWQDRSENYIPKMSDIIFFDWENDGICDHTGIVESIDIDNNKVKTIEGNSNDEVRERIYSLSDSRIVGYGTPDIY